MQNFVEDKVSRIFSLNSGPVLHLPLVMLVTGLVAFMPKAGAQDAGNANTYPTKPVRIIVPFPPGGSNDIIGRFIANKLSLRMSRQFVVDNRGGADSVIGTAIAAAAPPDGYTLLIASVTYAMVPATGKKLSYDCCRRLEIDSFRGLCRRINDHLRYSTDTGQCLTGMGGQSGIGRNTRYPSRAEHTHRFVGYASMRSLC